MYININTNTITYEQAKAVLKEKFGHEAELSRHFYVGEYSREKGYTYDPEAKGIEYSIEYTFNRPESMLIINRIDKTMWRIIFSTGKVAHSGIDRGSTWASAGKWYQPLQPKLD